MSNAYRSSKGAAAVLPTGDAVEANVLAGKTFSNASGTGKTGSMTNNGAVTQTISGGQSYTIPEGYHNGSGVVTAASPAFVDMKLIASSAAGNGDVTLYTASSSATILIADIIQSGATNAGSSLTIKKNGTDVGSINLANETSVNDSYVINVENGDTITMHWVMAGSNRTQFAASVYAI